MNNYRHATGAVILALFMGGLPAVALAEQGSDDGQGGEVLQVTSVQAEQVSREDETTQEARQQKKAAEVLREAEKQQSEISREQMKQRVEQARESLKQRVEITREMLKDRAEFLREGTTTPALSLEQLRQSIKLRKQELDDDEASSTPEARDIMKNVNPVRLAVHSLLASKDLLGGIGPEVSEIAKRMNDSVATTTVVEAKVQARGFITRLLFGGDKASGEAIAQAVAKNQENIQKLTELLAEASVSAEVQATMKAQLTALEDAQKRLSALADKEKTLWGLFSWRF